MKSMYREAITNLIQLTGAILLSLVAAAVVMLIAGYQPLAAYQALIIGAFGSSASIANTLSKSIPLLFTGLSFAFAAKGGMFNIGGEGQLYAGAMAATLIAIMLDGMSRYLVIPLAFIAGCAAGGTVGALVGVAKSKWKVNEVIFAIMLNYILQYLTSYLVSFPFKEAGSMTAQTVRINENYMLMKLIPRTQLTTALLLGIAAALFMVWFFKRTRAGYNIRAVGENSHAARAFGVPMTFFAIMTMFASGGLAGLAGVTEVFGKNGRFIDGFSPGFGFTGIAVAVLANKNPVTILLTSFLFGALDSGAMKMSYTAGISASMANVIQGLVILFVATPEIVRMLSRERRG